MNRCLFFPSFSFISTLEYRLVPCFCKFLGNPTFEIRMYLPRRRLKIILKALFFIRGKKLQHSKNANVSKTIGVWTWFVYFLKALIWRYIPTKIQTCRITTGFYRRGIISPSSPGSDESQKYWLEQGSSEQLSLLRKKCRYSEIFWSVFFRIWNEYGEILRICPYSIRMQDNTDQKYSK